MHQTLQIFWIRYFEQIKSKQCHQVQQIQHHFFETAMGERENFDINSFLPNVYLLLCYAYLLNMLLFWSVKQTWTGLFIFRVLKGTLHNYKTYFCLGVSFE